MTQQKKGTVSAYSAKNNGICIDEVWYNGTDATKFVDYSTKEEVDASAIGKGAVVGFKFKQESRKGRSSNAIVSSVYVFEAAPKKSYGGGKGGKKGWTDNSVGMGIGAAFNNAITLFAHDKIKESDILLVVAQLYKTTEYAKKLATDKEIDKLADIADRFGLTGAKTASKAKKDKAQEATDDTPDFDDEIPEDDFQDDPLPDSFDDEPPFDDDEDIPY